MKRNQDKREVDKIITESIPQYFFVYDYKHNKVTYLTDSFRKMVRNGEGTDLEKIKETIHPVYHLAFDTLITEIQKRNLKQDIDLRSNKEENSQQWINIRTYPIPNNKVVGQVRDITNRKNNEKQLRSESNRFEVILHLLLHDLRSPIGNMKEFASIIRESLHKGELEEVERFSEIIERLSGETIDLFNALNEMVEVNSNNFSLHLSKVNLTDKIGQIIENYSARHLSKKINFISDLPENGFEIKADPIKLRLVFQNLISNAIKFTPEGGEVKVSVTKDEETACILVSDNGIGIPKDKLSSIFEPFTPARRPGTNMEKSVGLGLSITKKIVENHNGKIEVESTEGEGSIFKVLLPLEQ